jgi:hypothetical protein
MPQLDRDSEVASVSSGTDFGGSGDARTLERYVMDENSHYQKCKLWTFYDERHRNSTRSQNISERYEGAPAAAGQDSPRGPRQD